MPLDLDLQELRRRVAAEPESATAWLALAHGLARAGAKGDAVETYYRARALGAEARPCREGGSGALGARPSPWTHVPGDSEHTFSAPVRGPRRGVVVAREGGSRERRPNVVVDEDACVVVCTDNAIERHGARSLARIAERGFELAGSFVVPTVSSAGVVFLTSRRGPTLLFRDGEPLRSVTLPGLAWQGASAAVVGGRVVVGLYGVPQNRFVVLSYDENLESERASEVEGARWGAWAASESGLALVVDQEIRGLGLDGKERYRRPAARWIDGLALVGDRAVWSELKQSDRTTKTRWVQMLDAKGDFVWGKNVEGQELPGRLAVSPEGTVHVASRDGLVRFASDGRELARGPGSLPGSGLVVDREGVAYVECEGEGDGRGRLGLAAVGLDGTRVFFVPEVLHPVALDGLGRLLALTDANALVAIE